MKRLPEKVLNGIGILMFAGAVLFASGIGNAAEARAECRVAPPAMGACTSTANCQQMCDTHYGANTRTGVCAEPPGFPGLLCCTCFE